MSNKTVKVSAIQQRHDTEANWIAKNPVLLDGEQITVLFDDGTTRHKTGYGNKEYNDLPFDNENADSSSESVNLTLLANNWTNKEQTIYVNGLKSDQNGVASLPQVVTDEQYAAAASARISISSQGEGTVTFLCKGDVPQIDIPVSLILFK